MNALRHQSSTTPAGILFIVSTPIGNLGDLSPRGLEVLSKCQLVAAEDTRVTRNLLHALNVERDAASPRILSVHEHNETVRIATIVSALRAGGSVALVSDAGTPTISDPGSRLVRAVRREGFSVSPVPGPCAAIAALSCSGVNSTAGFIFLGFLPKEGTERQRGLADLKLLLDNHHPSSTSSSSSSSAAASSRGGGGRPLILYESPHRLLQTLSDLERLFSQRKGTRSVGHASVSTAPLSITVARELTKVHEEIQEFPTISAALHAWQERLAREAPSGGSTETAAIPRGEFVLILHHEQQQEQEQGEAVATLEGDSGKGDGISEDPLAFALELVRDLLHSVPGLKQSEAVERVSKMLAVSKKELYRLQLKTPPDLEASSADVEPSNDGVSKKQPLRSKSKRK